MRCTREMVEERVVWEKLKNIQIFCGLGKFFFAFKKLNEDIDLDAAFIKLLTPADTSIHLENDIGRVEYQKHLRDGIFQYHRMPSLFYLRKLFHFCRLDESKYRVSAEETERMRLRLEQHSLRGDVHFEEQLAKFVQNKNALTEDDPELDPKSLSFKEMAFLIKLHELASLYRENPKAKRIFDDFSLFTCGQDFAWGKYFKTDQLEDLEFLDLLYKTKTFDNGKGTGQADRRLRAQHRQLPQNHARAAEEARRRSGDHHGRDRLRKDLLAQVHRRGLVPGQGRVLLVHDVLRRARGRLRELHGQHHPNRRATPVDGHLGVF